MIISAQTLRQGQTPMEMLGPGRVSSGLMSVRSIAQVAGPVVAGGMAQTVRIRNSYFATSVPPTCIGMFG